MGDPDGGGAGGGGPGLLPGPGSVGRFHSGGFPRDGPCGVVTNPMLPYQAEPVCGVRVSFQPFVDTET